jgi:integrase
LSYTLARYVPRWAAQQERKGRRSLERSLRQLELHVLPVLGAKQLGDIKPSEIIDLCWSLYRDGLGAKTVSNLRVTLSSVYSRAVFEQLVDSNPCKQIPRGELPGLGDYSPPKYEPTEVMALTTDPRIRLDRRVLYSLAFYLIERIGEACGCRFSDWDRSTKPLGTMTIDHQYDDQPLKSATGDHRAVRRVPVHPELARTLAHWKLSGFSEVYGRPPREDDFISPYPRTLGARTLSKAGHDLLADERTVGIPRLKGRGTHGFRKAFISMAHDAGANREAVRVLSHTGRSGDVLNTYTHWAWETLCETVELVRLPSAAQVISMEDRHA